MGQFWKTSSHDLARTAVAIALVVSGCKVKEAPSPDTPKQSSAGATQASTADHSHEAGYVPEAGDRQRLVTFAEVPSTDPRASDPSLLTVGSKLFVETMTNVTGTIVTVSHLGDLEDGDFEDERLLVATVKADVAFPDLGLSGNMDSLFLFKDPDQAGKWTATIRHSGTEKPLAVLRYTYAGISRAKDFPATARFDVVEAKQVIGIRCGRAWCMVGNIVGGDTADPGPNAQNTSLKPTRRVRGWFDRRPHPTAPNKKVSVYPIEDLGSLKRKDFMKDWVPVALIKSETADRDTATVKIRWDKASDKWWVRYEREGFPLIDREMKREPHPERRVPGAVRWDKRGPGVGLAAVGLGPLWVRCAGGCCSAEAFIPE